MMMVLILILVSAAMVAMVLLVIGLVNVADSGIGREQEDEEQMRWIEQWQANMHETDASGFVHNGESGNIRK